MKKPVTLVGYDRLMCRQAATFIGLQDGLALGRQTADVTADELLQVGLTLDEKVTANPGELVVPVFGHFKREHLHMFFVDQHNSSPALYLSCETRHSPASTSSRGPR